MVRFHEIREMSRRVVSEAGECAREMGVGFALLGENPLRSLKGRSARGLAGHDGQGGGDLLQTGFDVGRRGRPGVVSVSGVGAGHPIPEVSFDPGECGVAEPVDGDALCGDPGESFAEAFSEVVVAAAGERVSVAIAEQGIGVEDGAAGGGMVNQAVRERGGDGLPADGSGARLIVIVRWTDVRVIDRSSWWGNRSRSRSRFGRSWLRPVR
jgi:hypothetical protein